MSVTRRDFLEGLLAGAALAAAPGCVTRYDPSKRAGRIALQLYSIRDFIAMKGWGGVGLRKALDDVRRIGYEGVEFAGYYDCEPVQLRNILAENGLVVCGSHLPGERFGFDLGKGTFDADILRRTCEFERAYGNRLLICPGEGILPPGCTWKNTFSAKSPVAPSKEIDEHTKRLADFFNRGSEIAAGYGCRIGLHNHMWEHAVKLTDGTSFWDYFFGHTEKAVAMEQDVGWTTGAGVDPVRQYLKYPGRSQTLHAKENGLGKNITEFEGVLGKPGKPDAKPVDWDALFPVTDADGVGWYVVECERHSDSLDAVWPSFEFLKSKGRI